MAYFNRIIITNLYLQIDYTIKAFIESVEGKCFFSNSSYTHK